MNRTQLALGISLFALGTADAIFDSKFDWRLLSDIVAIILGGILIVYAFPKKP